MIQMLGGNEETVNNFKEAKGKTIAKVELKNDQLQFTFTDGTGIAFWDNGQSCCESRYMTCDDDLSGHEGATLEYAEIAPADQVEAEYDVHEVQFLRITTSKGVIVAETHNEHNGYYGGFYVVVTKL